MQDDPTKAERVPAARTAPLRAALAMVMMAAAFPCGAEPIAGANRSVTGWRACANGGIMLPGSDTCVRLGGAVRADLGVGARAQTVARTGLGRSSTRFGTSARIEADVRVPTELGPLRVFTSIRSRSSASDLR